MNSDGHFLIIGNTNSGKSYLAKYLLFNERSPLYNNYDLILLITDIPADIQFNNYEEIPNKHRQENITNPILNKITAYAKKHNYNKKILIIFDDLNKVILNKENYNNIIYLFTQGRHYNIYCMALVQYYKQLKPIIRTNAKYQILTHCNNVVLEELYNHMSHCFDSTKDIKDYVKSLNLPKYTSICFNTHTQDNNKKNNMLLIKPT
jgi:hypothetical protein